MSANNTDVVGFVNSTRSKYEDNYVGLLDFDSCALNLVDTKDGRTITGQLYRNQQDGTATFDVVEMDHHKEEGGVVSFKCEKPPALGMNFEYPPPIVPDGGDFQSVVTDLGKVTVPVVDSF